MSSTLLELYQIVSNFLEENNYKDLIIFINSDGLITIYPEKYKSFARQFNCIDIIYERNLSDPRFFDDLLTTLNQR